MLTQRDKYNNNINNVKQGENIWLLASILLTMLLLETKGDCLKAEHRFCYNIFYHMEHFYKPGMKIASQENSSVPLSKSPITPCKGLSSLSHSGLVSCQT